MFRAVVVTIVLTLGLGPATALLCAVQCEPGVQGAACEHQDATVTLRLTGHDSCDLSQAGSTAVVRSETRRDLTDVAPPTGAVTPAFHHAPAAHASPTGNGVTSPAPGAPPLRLALRI